MLRLLKAFLLSLPLALLFNALLWLLVAVVGWSFNEVKWENLFGLHLLKVESANDLFWPAALWVLAFLQASLLLVPVAAPAPDSAAPTPLGPRVLAAALLGGLPLAIPLFALIDVYYFLPKADPKTFQSGGCIMGVLAVWAVSWLVWTPILLHRSRREADALERFVGKSIKGSAVGLALCLPWYYVLRKKQACYCSLGGFWALVLGLWSLLIVGGPLLLILGRDRRVRAGLRAA